MKLRWIFHKTAIIFAALFICCLYQLWQETDDNGNADFSRISQINRTIQTKLKEARQFRVSLPSHESFRKISPQLFGGELGNYMFAVASTFGVARRNNFIPFLEKYQNKHYEELFEGLSQLGFCDENCKKRGIVVTEDNVGKYTKRTERLHKTLHGTQPILLGGYWQSWKYFNKYRPEILKMFTFKESIYKSALSEISKSQLKQFHSVLVGIHVRDFGDPNMEGNIHKYQMDPSNYIKKAVKHFRKKYKSVGFYLISNNPNYAMTFFDANDIRRDKDIFLISGSEPAMDMAILSLMDHLILTAGTFGWWGAYLSSAKEIFYFRDWITPDSFLGSKYNFDEYYYPTWNFTFHT